MIIVYVEHFLNEEGQHLFPGWITKVADALRDFEGFISIRQLRPVDNENECHLLLEFENPELLRKWTSSKAHDQLIDKLAPFRYKQQNVKVFHEEQVIG